MLQDSPLREVTDRYFSEKISKEDYLEILEDYLNGNIHLIVYSESDKSDKDVFR